MPGCGCTNPEEFAATNQRQKNALIILLVINTLFFIIELGAAWWGGSSALLADSGDMLADAIVYAVSLFALGRTAGLRAGAGLLTGVFQLLLGVGVIAQIVHIIVSGDRPEGMLMLAVAAAAAANLAGAALLLRHRRADINMRAVWLCTRNDVIGNVATIAAGAVVMVLQTPWPDVVVGGLLALLFIRTAAGVIREALTAMRKAPAQAMNAQAHQQTRSRP